MDWTYLYHQEIKASPWLHLISTDMFKQQFVPPITIDNIITPEISLSGLGHCVISRLLKRVNPDCDVDLDIATLFV